MTVSRSIAAAAPGVLVAVLPKCPICLGAYLAFASGLALPISPGRFVALTLALLALALVVLARAASRARRWPAFGVAAIGGGLVTIARVVAASSAWTWIGVALLYAGAAWICAFYTASREVGVLLDPRRIDRTALAGALESRGYIADDALVMTLFLALRIETRAVGRRCAGRRQDAARAHTTRRSSTRRCCACSATKVSTSRARRSSGTIRDSCSSCRPGAAQLYREELLLRRPLLQAIDASHARTPVLLVDEIDRADEEFEAFLLELLGDFQITDCRLGALRAEHRPIVILTSNRTREVHDALKRRCLYHWIDYPRPTASCAIVRARVPELDAILCRRVVAFVQALRGVDLAKAPGVAETVDWATALRTLGATRLDVATARPTLGLLLQYVDDIDAFAARCSTS